MCDIIAIDVACRQGSSIDRIVHDQMVTVLIYDRVDSSNGTGRVATAYQSPRMQRVIPSNHGPANRIDKRARNRVIRESDTVPGLVYDH